MKTYLVSEELLRQVLDVAVSGAANATDDETYRRADEMVETINTILAKEPNEPVAWEYECYRTVFIGGPMWVNELSPTPPPDDPDEVEFRNAIPLYRKDAT